MQRPLTGPAKAAVEASKADRPVCVAVSSSPWDNAGHVLRSVLHEDHGLLIEKVPEKLPAAVVYVLLFPQAIMSSPRAGFVSSQVEGTCAGLAVLELFMENGSHTDSCNAHGFYPPMDSEADWHRSS